MPESEGSNGFKNPGSFSIAEMAKRNPEALDSLRKMGLNQYQAQAYVALLARGKMTAGQLSEEGAIPRPRTYDVLESLKQIGFVAERQGRPVQYAPLPVEEAVKTMRKHRQVAFEEELEQLENLGGKLQTAFKASSVEPAALEGEHVWTLKGRGTIYSKMASMIQNAKKQVVLAASSNGLCRKMEAHSKYLAKAAKRGVDVHFVAPVDESHTCYGDAAKIGKVWRHASPTRMLLADDEALLFLTHEHVPADEEVGLWVRSPHLVNTFKQALPMKA